MKVLAAASRLDRSKGWKHRGGRDYCDACVEDRAWNNERTDAS